MSKSKYMQELEKVEEKYAVRFQEIKVLHDKHFQDLSKNKASIL